MTILPRIFVLGTLALAPVATNSAESSACHAQADATSEDQYPDIQLSPQESLAHHDAVFLGEVVVPTKACSLGACAGLKVVRALKGEVNPTVLVRVTRADADPCAPKLFQNRGGRWMVFANSGTSKTGHLYLQVADDGPSYAAKQVPNFSELEGRYRMLRARLDNAIDAQMGRLR